MGDKKDRFRITGPCRLEGEVIVSGAKNAALPLMAAALLTGEQCVIENVPVIEDTRNLAEIMRLLGSEVDFDAKQHRVTVRAANLDRTIVPTDLAARMRASFLVTGPLLARSGAIAAPPPGGCDIGQRPVNVDIKGFLAMGADYRQENGSYMLQSKRLVGRRLYLDYPSHTGTENLLMAACLARGHTTIKNASGEPEVVALAACLAQMGARISGAGTSVIEVEGVDSLKGTHTRVIPDRIEAGTFALAAAATGGDIVLRDVIPSHIDPLTHKLQEIGAEVEEKGNTYHVWRRGPLRPVEVQTLPYPGFPTDLQAALATTLTLAEGTSIVHERVYDNRLQYVGQLLKMGASIKAHGQTATVNGPSKLKASAVRALDIRSGAALILAALVADGTTEISDIYHIDRGYERLEDKLGRLGADIQRLSTEQRAA
ncbi:MAG: UDP-N-acetylglucosamine 1-carboxyvinyltransferase [Chloroflexi bacterium]|nr:UDP-N-acetylglucosamine 1-carboxyvinyltransferase [Chloroflexota bacterium]